MRKSGRFRKATSPNAARPMMLGVALASTGAPNASAENVPRISSMAKKTPAGSGEPATVRTVGSAS
ncbi:hypothetical protein ACWGI9_19780 [Streptomyces sp. NPDC054833]